MRFVIFCLLISFYLCGDPRFFRFWNGTSIKGNENPRPLSGTLCYHEFSSSIVVYFHGMDYSTMSPIYLVLGHQVELTTDSKVDVNCWGVRDGIEDSEALSGKGHLRFYSDRCELSAECYTRTGDLWVFKSLNIETEKIHYSQKEAGFRAKFLIGQPTSKYKPPYIINFAILDYPYYYDSCLDYRNWYSDAPRPEPGAIMLGKDGKHCAILDDEGTKFIQSNPVTGKVTYDSIAVAERYFPNGIVYKRWPDE